MKYAISKSCVNSSASTGQASSQSPQNMHREVSQVKVVSTFLRVASSRCQPTTIRFSGQANAHKLQPIHSVSFVSGLLLSRGAPRYRSATIGRSSGYCSVTMFFGCCVRKVTARPFKKSTWNNRSRSSRMRLVCFSPPQLSSNAFCRSPTRTLSVLGPFFVPPHVILSRKMEADTQFMQEALAEARAAAAAGEVPIGAVLVHDGKILARSGNHHPRL